MIVTSKCAIKNLETYLIFSNSSPICPHSFSFQKLSLYFLFDMSYNSSHLRTSSREGRGPGPLEAVAPKTNCPNIECKLHQRKLGLLLNGTWCRVLRFIYRCCRWVIYQRPMFEVARSVGEKMLTAKPVTVSLCPPQIRLGLHLDRSRFSSAGYD